MQLVYGWMLDGLQRARRPANHDAVDVPRRPQAEVQPAIVLARESHPAVDQLELTRATALEGHLGTDRAAIALGSHELEPDPVVAGRDGVLIDQGRLVLIRDDDVEHAAVEQVGERDGTPIVRVRDADERSNVRPPGEPPVHEYP